jgi:hypothetical protein
MKGLKKEKPSSSILCTIAFFLCLNLYIKPNKKFPPIRLSERLSSSAGQRVSPYIYLLSSQKSGFKNKPHSSTRLELASLFGPIAPFEKLKGGNDKKNTLYKEYSRLCGFFEGREVGFEHRQRQFEIVGLHNSHTQKLLKMKIFFIWHLGAHSKAISSKNKTTLKSMNFLQIHFSDLKDAISELRI